MRTVRSAAIVAVIAVMALRAADGFAASGDAVQGVGSAEEKASSRRPNVLLIVADDQGYGDLGC